MKRITTIIIAITVAFSVTIGVRPFPEDPTYQGLTPLALRPMATGVYQHEKERGFTPDLFNILAQPNNITKTFTIQEITGLAGISRERARYHVSILVSFGILKKTDDANYMIPNYVRENLDDVLSHLEKLKTPPLSIKRVPSIMISYELPAEIKQWLIEFGLDSVHELWLIKIDLADLLDIPRFIEENRELERRLVEESIEAIVNEKLPLRERRAGITRLVDYYILPAKLKVLSWEKDPLFREEMIEEKFSNLWAALYQAKQNLLLRTNTRRSANKKLLMELEGKIKEAEQKFIETLDQMGITKNILQPLPLKKQTIDNVLAISQSALRPIAAGIEAKEVQLDKIWEELLNTSSKPRNIKRLMEKYLPEIERYLPRYIQEEMPKLRIASKIMEEKDIYALQSWPEVKKSIEWLNGKEAALFIHLNRTPHLSPALKESIQEMFVLKGLPYVAYIVGKIKSKKFDREDLLNEGVIGLINAFDGYDFSANAQFTTYAEYRIKGTPRDQLIQHGHRVRMPTSAIIRRRKILNFINMHKEEHGAEPTIDEIAKGLNLPPARLIDFLSDISIENLDELLDETKKVSHKVEIVTSIPFDFTKITTSQQREYIYYLMYKYLTPYEQLIIKLYYGWGAERKQQGYTVEEIADRLNTAKGAVYAIVDKAKNKLIRHAGELVEKTPTALEHKDVFYFERFWSAPFLKLPEDKKEEFMYYYKKLVRSGDLRKVLKQYVKYPEKKIWFLRILNGLSKTDLGEKSDITPKWVTKYETKLSNMLTRENMVERKNSRTLKTIRKILSIIKAFELDEDIAEFLWNRTAEEQMRYWKVTKLGKKIMFLRVLNGLNQIELAEKADISPDALARYESEFSDSTLKVGLSNILTKMEIIEKRDTNAAQVIRTILKILNALGYKQDICKFLWDKTPKQQMRYWGIMRNPGEKIRFLRMLKGWNQYDLLKKAGIARTPLSKYETRLSEVLTKEVILEKLGVKITKNILIILQALDVKEDIAEFLWDRTKEEQMKYWKIEKPGRKITFLRVLRGLSQTELAEKANIAPLTVARYETSSGNILEENEVIERIKPGATQKVKIILSILDALVVKEDISEFLWGMNFKQLIEKHKINTLYEKIKLLLVLSGKPQQPFHSFLWWSLKTKKANDINEISNRMIGDLEEIYNIAEEKGIKVEWTDIFSESTNEKIVEIIDAKKKASLKSSRRSARAFYKRRQKEKQQTTDASRIVREPISVSIGKVSHHILTAISESA